MIAPLDSALIQMGTVESCRFSGLQWESFPVTFPEPFPGDDVAVTVTASSFGELRPSIGIAQKVSSSGFTLAVRNPCCAGGSLDFEWMAVAYGQYAEKLAPVGLRLGVLQPRVFQPDGARGDWQLWNGVKFSSPFQHDRPVVLLTASDADVEGINASCVGVVHLPGSSGFNLAAHNSGCSFGGSSFYYLAGAPLSREMAPEKSCLWVDSGMVEALDLAPDCEVGGDGSMEIAFSKPFSVPPVVLVTANDLGVRGHNAAALGVAQKVTTRGFALSARNTEGIKGQAGFFWTAVGCAKGCR